MPGINNDCLVVAVRIWHEASDGSATTPLETVSQHLRDLSVSGWNIPVRGMTCNTGLLKQAWFPNCGSRIRSKISHRRNSTKEISGAPLLFILNARKKSTTWIGSLSCVFQSKSKSICTICLPSIAPDSFTRLMLCDSTIYMPYSLISNQYQGFNFCCYCAIGNEAKCV
jgi:hypothetical protein